MFVNVARDLSSDLVAASCLNGSFDQQLETGSGETSPSLSSALLFSSLSVEDFASVSRNCGILDAVTLEDLDFCKDLEHSRSCFLVD